MTFQNAGAAFAEALRVGRLSDNPNDSNYAGNYMYMGTDNQDNDLFKHIDTREYLPLIVIYPELI